MYLEKNIDFQFKKNPPEYSKTKEGFYKVHALERNIGAEGKVGIAHIKEKTCSRACTR